jgi:hypothetical protein
MARWAPGAAPGDAAGGGEGERRAALTSLPASESAAGDGDGAAGDGDGAAGDGRRSCGRRATELRATAMATKWRATAMELRATARLWATARLRATAMAWLGLCARVCVSVWPLVEENGLKAFGTGWYQQPV